MNYIICGQMTPFMLKNEYIDGSVPVMSGTAFCALTGVRLWTESVQPVAKAGNDFEGIFGEWLVRHGVPVSSVLCVEDERCARMERKSGAGYSFSSGERARLAKLEFDSGMADGAAQYDDTKGIYAAAGQDIEFWRELYDIKSRKGPKIMWEYCEDQSKAAAKAALNHDIMTFTDMWSINIAEASRLFKIPQKNEEDIINEIIKLPAELTLLRAGKKGSYAITPSGAALCESVDIADTRENTGCGSVATGAAMYAFCEGYAPAMVAVMANVAAGYHAAQTGPIDHITTKVMKEAREKADEYYRKITGRI